MPTRKVWREWILVLRLRRDRGVNVERTKDGWLDIGGYEFSPPQARRLFQKLSGDYRTLLHKKCYPVG